MGVALAVTSLVLGGVGVVGNMMASYSQAEAQNRANAYNAQIAANNAALAYQQAQEEANNAQYNSDKARTNYKKSLGAQIAARAKSGVLVNSGSAADTQYDLIKEGEQDSLMELYNGYRSANAIAAQGQNYSAQSSMYQSANVSPGLAAGMSLLSGMSGLATQAYGYKWNFGNSCSSC